MILLVTGRNKEDTMKYVKSKDLIKFMKGFDSDSYSECFETVDVFYKIVKFVDKL